ncbi:hypothetical protein [Streptomyces mobaraensis]|uniref:Uncharacterized protein n=1 Tax=Streptomyces mobaraensis TaxID=35621 RepID=A0A5N5W8Y3_STRMB|nr:hypothetical protein [Streptomyces mobaraensis]KAB7844430.1 hypothetical protein FRZ00_16160 [Streptomyces mobaraensis]
MYPPSSSAFASVRRHFDELRVGDPILVVVPTGIEGAKPVRLTAAEAYEALYSPDRDPQFASAVWKEAIRSALSNLDAHGTGKLLVIWLALPRLIGTVHRICGRLRADRLDVEAEMILALLEELAAPDAESRLSDSSLIHAARTRAWRFARDGLQELPSIQVERIAHDRAPITPDGEADAPAEEGLDVRVDRPDGPDGLCAPLRFRVRPEHLRTGAIADTDDGTWDRSTHHRPRKKRRPGCRVDARTVRPARRRA